MGMVKFGDIPVKKEEKVIKACKIINCPHCGEQIPDIYDICPKCQKAISKE